ncbi:HTH-type transcriptional regulator AdhR [Grimontia celer]|uniref:HTH-type transcriptional regulator AdhR n=1 Tax=Grimontia celer TaxID=1796497 RepID=A0A128FAF5_9GAMM|nr:MerR family transcriptional regulator [Grimontia celer]CZF83286.1 HTH-type transcriptional regulator AdhR [Grimontia celer]
MRIQEASAASGLSCHTLRYYERSGLIYPIPRDSSGHRYYREHDIRWLQFVQCLKVTGMPLKDIKSYAEQVQDSENKANQLLNILFKHKERLENKLAETQDFLKHIDWKINHYSEILHDHQ